MKKILITPLFFSSHPRSSQHSPFTFIRSFIHLHIILTFVFRILNLVLVSSVSVITLL